MKKIALYTAIFGRVSRFIVPRISDEAIDKFCFTNMKVESHFYKVKFLRLRGIKPSIMKQRRAKICIPDEIFQNYEYSIYVDCKRPYSLNLEYLLGCMEQGSDFLTRRHNRRSCVYDEGEFCILKKKDREEVIRRQLDFYRSEGYPAHNGLHASGFLLRRHTDKMKEFLELWWGQVKKYSHRDQISLPYIAWKFGMKISVCGRGK